MSEPENKTPAMPWYPRDFAADEPVQLMSLEEEGAYRRLLDHQWLHGSVPSDVAQLARICKNVAPAKMRKIWPAIAPLFFAIDGDPSRLQNRKVERVRAAQIAYKKKQSESGKAGAEARWKDKHPDGDPNGGRMATPLADDWLAVAVASASAQEPPPTPAGVEAGKQFARLLNRLPVTGRAKVSVTELLEKLPDGQQLGWICSFLNYLDGGGLPAGVKPTAEQLATACQDYLAVNPATMGPAHFRSFLVRVVRDAGKSPPQRSGCVSSRTANTLRAIEELAAEGDAA